MIKKVKIPIYGGNLFIMITEDYQKDKDEIHADWRPTKEDFLGYTAALDNRYFIIINKGYKSNDITIASTIAHEALHIANFICKRVGIKLDYENDEPHAYLISWVTEQVYKHYKTKLK